MLNSTGIYIVPPPRNLSYYINISGYGCGYLTQSCITINSLSWKRTLITNLSNYKYVNFSSSATGPRSANITTTIDWTENNTRYLIQTNLSLAANFPEFCVDLDSNGCSISGNFRAKCRVKPVMSKPRIFYYPNNQTDFGNDYFPGFQAIADDVDNCPIYYPEALGNCRDPSNYDPNENYAEQYYNSDAKCFTGQMKLKTSPLTFYKYRQYAYCLKAQVRID